MATLVTRSWAVYCALENINSVALDLDCYCGTVQEDNCARDVVYLRISYSSSSSICCCPCCRLCLISTLLYRS